MKVSLKRIKSTSPRRDSGDIGGLKASISDLGLINPLTVDQDMRLLAGRRRYQALVELGWKEVEVKVMPCDGDGLRVFAIALAENIHRKDLTDPEVAAVIKEYDELKRKLEGERKAGGRGGVRHDVANGQGWTQDKTAEDLGISRQAVTKAIKIATAIEEHPVLTGLRSGTAILREATKLERKDSPLPEAGKRMEHKVIVGDARDVLPLLPAGCVDLVVTSPPYFGLKEYEHHLGVNIEDWPLYLCDLRTVFTECHRVLKQGSFICVVAGQYTSKNNSYYIPGHIASILDSAGFRFRREHIWVKPLGVQGIWNRGTTSFLHEPWPRNTMVNIHHEHILVCQKGDGGQVFPGRNGLSEGEVKEYCWSVWELLPSPVKEHPAPFPLEIPQRLIKMYSYEGEVVLDPFLGAGTTIQAARALNRRAWGVEVEPKYLPLIQQITGGVNVVRYDMRETLGAGEP